MFATTYSDMQTAADKCEEMEDGYAQCSQFLYGEAKLSVTRAEQNPCETLRGASGPFGGGRFHGVL